MVVDVAGRRHRGAWRGHLRGAARPGRRHGERRPTADGSPLRGPERSRPSNGGSGCRPSPPRAGGTAPGGDPVPAGPATSPTADAGGISAINGSIRIAGVGPPEAPADFERLSAYGQLAGEVDVPGLRLLGVQVPAARRLRDGSPLGGLCALSRGTDNGAARQGGYRQPRCYVSGSRCLVVTLPGAPGPWPGRLPGCVRRLSVSGTASVPAT